MGTSCRAATATLTGTPARAAGLAANAALPACDQYRPPMAAAMPKRPATIRAARTALRPIFMPAPKTIFPIVTIGGTALSQVKIALEIPLISSVYAAFMLLCPTPDQLRLLRAKLRSSCAHLSAPPSVAVQKSALFLQRVRDADF